MNYMLVFFAVLSLATLGSAQQQGQELSNLPGYRTPSIFPGNSQRKAPPMSTAEVKEQIQAGPMLASNSRQP